MGAMGSADFLLSPLAQQLLKAVLADPAQQFSVAELAKLARAELTQVEQATEHLVASGVLCRELSTAGEIAMLRANTAFVFYAELRRIALKSFAAAEPLGAMLRSKFRDTVARAFVLGEDRAGALQLLLVYDAAAPDKALLDQALRRLLKSGAIRQHVQADVIAERRFQALRPGDALHALLAADTCIDISPVRGGKARPKASPAAPAAPVGLLEKARRRLAGLGR
jgi:hypothetical protein